MKFLLVVRFRLLLRVRVLFVCFGLDVLQVFVEPIKSLLPELAIFVEPSGGFAKGVSFELAGSPLGFATTGDEASSLEHAKVFGDGRHAHLKGLG